MDIYDRGCYELFHKKVVRNLGSQWVKKSFGGITGRQWMTPNSDASIASLGMGL